MKILILGTSSKSGVSYLIGEILREADHEIIYTGRNDRKLDRLVEHKIVRCDVTVPADLAKRFEEYSPDVVIHAAGAYCSPKKLGTIRRLAVEDHLLVKSLGTLLVLSQAAATPSVQYVIALGGREVSQDPGYSMYTVGNGAMWSAIQFANLHSNLKCFFLDLPLVEGSTMAAKYLADEATDKSGLTHSISPLEIAIEISEILTGARDSAKRIVLKPEWVV